MTNADNMFNNLGYVKEEIHNDHNKLVVIYYDKPDNKSIDFYLEENNISLIGDFNMEELKAINEKVKELGWYD